MMLINWYMNEIVKIFGCVEINKVCVKMDEEWDV